MRKESREISVDDFFRNGDEVVLAKVSRKELGAVGFGNEKSKLLWLINNKCEQAKHTAKLLYGTP